MLDRKERLVYINPDIQHEGRRRFLALHEVGHDVLPSQHQLAYADNTLTLSWLARQRLERDASQAAAELLFQVDFFRRMANEYAIGIASLIELADVFGASYQSALRRYAETHRADVAGIVLDHSPCARAPLAFRRHEACCSASWEARFGRPDRWPVTLNETVFPFLPLATQAGALRSTAAGEFRYPDLDNTMRSLRVEILSNSFNLLVLLWRPRLQRLKRRRRVGSN